MSHGRSALVNELLGDIQRLCADSVVLALTRNIPHLVAFATGELACPCETIVNAEPKGFGANHNAAFSHCRTPYFCVVNPDIRLVSDPFPALLETLQHGRGGVFGPLARNPSGGVENSTRRFPTPRNLLIKAMSFRTAPDYPIDQGTIAVDWVAGVFMQFRGEAFRAVSGGARRARAFPEGRSDKPRGRPFRVQIAGLHCRHFLRKIQFSSFLRHRSGSYQPIGKRCFSNPHRGNK